MNISEYKDAFLTEAREYLSNLNNSLVLLEKNQNQTDAINDIFRAAHTLKGMSATMGYDPMVRLTHQMETALESIRSGTQKLSTHMVDILFNCLDQLEKWVEVLVTQESIEEDHLPSLLKMLISAWSAGTESKNESNDDQAILSDGPLEFTEMEREIYANTVKDGFLILKITIDLVLDCVFKEVRAFMILKKLNIFGEIIKTQPSPEEIEKGHFEDKLQLILITQRKPEEVKSALINVGDVLEVKIDILNLRDEKQEFLTRNGSELEFKAASISTGGHSLDSDERKNVLPTIRVHTSKLDKLMALVQELVISKIRFEEVANSNSLKELSDPLSQLNHITEELQDEIMKVRLMPVKQIFERFPRMIRDLSKNLNKQIDLEMDGAEVELDRTILEEMSEPLVHLLRNAVDHGIELPEVRLNFGKEAYGTIRLQAKRERSYVLISISDDGQGIDPEVIRNRSVSKGLISSEEVSKLTDDEVIRLIALPGFSTVDKATEISGRGVGVDVAKTKVETLGGTFRIQSKKGHGTTFILKFPLTLAIIKALLVRCNQETFAIPVVNITETIDVIQSDKKIIQQQETILLRGDVIPIYPLQELLDLPPSNNKALSEYETVLVIELGDSRLGLKVDEVVTQQEIAIKPLDRILKSIRGFSGATILGNGKIALILDINGLVDELKDKRFQLDHPFYNKEDVNVAQS